MYLSKKGNEMYADKLKYKLFFTVSSGHYRRIKLITIQFLFEGKSVRVAIRQKFRSSNYTKKRNSNDMLKTYEWE